MENKVELYRDLAHLYAKLADAEEEAQSYLKNLQDQINYNYDRTEVLTSNMRKIKQSLIDLANDIEEVP